MFLLWVFELVLVCCITYSILWNQVCQVYRMVVLHGPRDVHYRPCKPPCHVVTWRVNSKEPMRSWTLGSLSMFQWCSLRSIEHLLEGYWYIGSLFSIFSGTLLKIPNFMRSLLGHGKIGPSSGFGPIFHPWTLISVHFTYLRILGYGLPLWDRTKPICHLILHFKSDSGMYA